MDDITAAAQNLAPEAYADAPLAVATEVTTRHLVPGAAVETVADRVANEALRAEPVAATEVPETPLIIETATPAANLATRSNIVPDGPGTVGDFLV
jgi:hypothetical protein